MVRKVTIEQFLTPEEIEQAKALYRANKDTPTKFHKAVVDQIIRPNIRRINADLGQDNDPGYLGYAVEYVFSRTGV